MMRLLSSLALKNLAHCSIRLTLSFSNPMRCVCLIDDDINALKKSIPSLEKDLEIRFTADKNKFYEFGGMDGFIQNNDKGYSVHKLRPTTTQPPLKGKRAPRLWILLHKQKQVYIQVLLYPVESEPQYRSSAVSYTHLTLPTK